LIVSSNSPGLKSSLTVAAAKKWEAIQELKKEGCGQAEVREILGLPKSTVGRFCTGITLETFVIYS